jgi:hypothetical protein
MNTIKVKNIAELKLRKGTTESTVEVLGYYTEGDGGGGTFFWDNTNTTPDDGGGYIAVIGVSVGRWCFSNPDKITPLNFGAKNNAYNTICNATGTTVTVTGASFTSDDVGKTIQIYRGGSSTLSHQSIIASVISSTSVTLTLGVSTNRSNVPCVIGTNSKQAIIKYIDYLQNKKIYKVTISGNFLIGDVTNGNITLGHFLFLKYSNTIYDFKNSKIFGNVLIYDDNGFPQINNCIVENLFIYSLGDGADATSANTNWNGVGIAEGSNNIFRNITVHSNGGVRGFSAQSDNVTGGISNLTVESFDFLGIVDYEKTDGFDISAIGVNSIRNVKVNNVNITNCGRGFYVNSITASQYFTNIVTNNVVVKNCYKQTFRAFRTKESIFNNFTLEKTGNNVEPAIELNNSTINLNNFNLNNSGVLTDFLLSTSDSNGSYLNNISLVNIGSKSPNGILLFSPNMFVNNLYIENVTTGLYKGGVYTTIDGYKYKNVTDSIRGNTIDANLNIKNITELFDSANSIQHPLSGFLAKAYVSFDASQANGTLTLLNSNNILSVVKTATGLFTITFKYDLKTLPIMSGSARYYGGFKLPSVSNYPSNTSINIRIEDGNGNLGDSDYVGLIFF